MTGFKNLWIEKYRPNTLDELCITPDNKARIQKYVDDDEIPHLLLCGPTGVGKTSLARLIVLDILKCDYLYINASDENGVETIRNKVSGFVQTKSFDGNIKVVILDEADYLSPASQGILRNMMESYAGNARFILTGNYRHKITTALQSRCQPINLQLSVKDALVRCLYILKCEGISASQEEKKNLTKLIKKYSPDLRLCIGMMSMCCIDGKLVVEQLSNTTELCVKILSDIESGATLELRTYLIQNDGIFNSDWDQLLIDLLNHIYQSDVQDSKKKAMVCTIADHLEMSYRVIDKEINFFACVLNLEKD